jgi:hypothetical protein
MQLVLQMHHRLAVRIYGNTMIAINLSPENDDREISIRGWLAAFSTRPQRLNSHMRITL